MTKQTEFIPFMGVVEFDDNSRVNETLTNKPQKETGTHMRKKSKLTLGKKVLDYIKANPDAKPAVVAHQCGVRLNYVYSVRHAAKLTKTSPKKEKIIMTHDSVNHPPHYKVGGIETIDFIEAKSLGYNLGNVVKYITRADHKGNKIEDLKKGAWYLLREIKALEKAR